MFNLVLLSIAISAQNYDVDLAVQSYARTGQTTELRLTLPDVEEGRYVLEISQDQVSQHHAFEPAKLTDRQFTAATPALTAEPLSVILRRNEQVLLRQQVSPRLRSGDRKLVLLSAGLTDQFSGDAPPLLNADVLISAVQEFPHMRAGYNAIDLVVAHQRDVEALTATQLQALQAHAGGCGRVLLVANTPSKWRQSAGCGGNYLLSLATDENLISIVESADHLLRQAPEPLPSAVQIARALTFPTPTKVLFLTLLVLALAPLYILANRMARRPPVALALAVIASLSIYLATSSTKTQTMQLVWLELRQGDHIARVQHVVATQVEGFGSAQLQMPSSHPWQSLQYAATLHHTDHTLANAAAHATTNWRSVLAEQRVFFSLYNQRYQAPLAIERPAEPSSRPVVTNQSDQPSAPATLAWNNKRFEVPSLTPGQRWQPDTPAPWGKNATLRLFKERALRHDVALMVRHPLPAASNSVGEEIRVLLL